MSCWKPHVTVASIVENSGRFLMVEELVRGQRMINQPAGHLEPDETLVDAAARETLEETGWVVEPVALVGIYQWQDPALEDGILRVCFHAQAVKHQAHRPLDEGIIEALWLSPAGLDEHPAQARSPLVRRCIEDFRDGRRFSLDALSALS